MTSDPEWRFVIQKALRVPVPSKTSEIEEKNAAGVKTKRRITPAEYYELLQRSGPQVKAWIAKNKEKMAAKTEQDAQDELSKAAAEITHDEMQHLRKDLKIKKYSVSPTVPVEPPTVPAQP